MARIKIEELPVMEDLSEKEIKGIFGGLAASQPEPGQSVSDWFIGTPLKTHTFPTGSVSSFNVFSSCCRISTLQDSNNDMTARTLTRLNLDFDGTESP